MKIRRYVVEDFVYGKQLVIVIDDINVNENIDELKCYLIKCQVCINEFKSIDLWEQIVLGIFEDWQMCV